MPLARRWHRQSHMITTVVWLRALAAGTVSIEMALAALPSALATSPTTGEVLNLIEVSGNHHIVDDQRHLDEPDPWLAVITSVLPERTPASVQVRILLPRPGDPRGLRGDPLADSCSSGAIVDIEGAAGRICMAAMREHEGLVTWRLHHQAAISTDASPPTDRTSIPEADRELRRSILEAEGLLSDLGHRGLGGVSREVIEDSLDDLFESLHSHNPDLVDLAVLSRAIRIAWTCDLALTDDSPAVTLADAQDRRGILADLDRAARRAVEASVSAR